MMSRMAIEANPDPIARTILRWRAYRASRRAAALEPRPCSNCGEMVRAGSGHIFETEPSFTSRPKAFCTESCWFEWDNDNAI